jgi:hydroxyacylglutathione hydrolase
MPADAIRAAHLYFAGAQPQTNFRLMLIEIVGCLADNYCYVVANDSSRRALIVDPSESAHVLHALDRLGLEPEGVLCTHHHADHVGGLPELLGRFPRLRVFGHPLDRKRLPSLTDEVAHDSRVSVAGLSALALHVPGHTRGAIAWVIEDAVFTGDTMFVAGCGKLFEGSAQQMHASLNEVLGSLPGETRVYCGHEYTDTNLRFALRVDPTNTHCVRKLQQTGELRAAGRPTIPSTIAQERATNPFLRCEERALIETARREGCEKLDPVSIFAWLRRRKDTFRPSTTGFAPRKT